ncbi:hypothetical protein CENSYa_1713 [Cenarchaeum symbiosum A]|uniref:Uncharacterized protein n=1 Tax=Cenarchaeum symbiosum (strain A) TaxID=414004 RepID=A0RYA9_CENSY|nr:hypothetical protein CENSYa_1713 [Cenarchaeum symbiosum A]
MPAPEGRRKIPGHYTGRRLFPVSGMRAGGLSPAELRKLGLIRAKTQQKTFKHRNQE